MSSVQKHMPAHVSLILGSEIHLEGIAEAQLVALRERGLTPVRSLLGLWSLRAPEVAGALCDHPEGVDFLGALVGAGLAFLRDPRQGWSPADVIELLLERGDYRGCVCICAFDGSHWILSDAGEP